MVGKWVEAINRNSCLTSFVGDSVYLRHAMERLAGKTSELHREPYRYAHLSVRRTHML